MYFSSEIHYLLKNIIEFVFNGFALILAQLNLFAKPVLKFIIVNTGVGIDGENSYDIKVKDNRFYGLIIAKGFSGFFDSYIAGYIDSDDLEETFMKFLRTHPLMLQFDRYHPYRLLKYFIHTYFDALTPKTIRNATKKHYEDDAEFMKKTLGSIPQYSTMLLYDLDEVENANPEQIEQLLDEGAFRARENIAKKLKLEPGMKVLDIGCGFGGLAKHLAERYKVEVTGVTICQAMAQHASKVCKGLPINIIFNDYRAVTGKFDRIVSIEMFEHVGEIHHREYFEKVNNLLTEDGVFVFQAHHCGPDYMASYTPVLENSLEMYCFFPRLEEIAHQSKGLLIVENVENLGYCFGVTGKALLKNMVAKKATLKNVSEEQFRRAYIYGCLSKACGLTAVNRVYQIVFMKNGYRYAYSESLYRNK